MSRLIDINPDFASELKDMTRKQKLSFLNILYNGNEGNPPKGFFNEKIGKWVFKSDDSKNLTIISKGENGEYNVELREYNLADLNSKGSLFNQAIEFNNGGVDHKTDINLTEIGAEISFESISISKQKIFLKTDGSITQTEKTLSAGKIEGAIDSDGATIGVSAVDSEWTASQISSPMVKMEGLNNPTVFYDEGEVGIGLRLGGKIGGGKGFIDAGPVSFKANVDEDSLDFQEKIKSEFPQKEWDQLIKELLLERKKALSREEWYGNSGRSSGQMQSQHKDELSYIEDELKRIQERETNGSNGIDSKDGSRFLKNNQNNFRLLDATLTRINEKIERVRKNLD